MRPPEGTLGSPEQIWGPSDGAPPSPVCFGRVGAFCCSQLHLLQSLHRLSGEFSLVVSAAVQGIQHSSNAHSTPPAISRTGTCPGWGCRPPPSPAPSFSHSPSQTSYLCDFSRQDLPCSLPSCPPLWGVTGAPHPLPPPGAPQPPSPSKLSSCLTSSKPRSRHSKQRLGAASCSSICPAPSASSCPTSRLAAPCKRGLPFPRPSVPPAQDGRLA